tara:strand:- start:1209 stop:1448 length:240 start_codon:yes stop_codon:yes gene_type:complete
VRRGKGSEPWLRGASVDFGGVFITVGARGLTAGLLGLTADLTAGLLGLTTGLTARPRAQTPEQTGALTGLGALDCSRCC